jgi:hypothetical protein
VLLAVFVPAGCSAETQPATDRTYDSAKLHGIVRWEAGDGPGSIWLQYRALGAQGWLEQGPRRSWPRMQAAGSAPVEKTLMGLSESTTYEYRICSKLDAYAPTVCYDKDGSHTAGAWDRFTTATHPTLTPKSAFTFTHSVGVATHPTYFDTPGHAPGAGGEARTAQLIANAGIRHVRNGMAISNDGPWNNIVWDSMASWHRAGITSSWGVDRCTVTWPGNVHNTVREFLDKIAEIDGDMSDAIEGTNEVNNFCSPDWRNREPFYVAHLFQQVNDHPDPVIRNLPVLGPSFAWWTPNDWHVGDWIDLGNTHPYSGCTSPTPQHVQTYGIDSYAPVSGGKRVWVTEVGYHTAINSTEQNIQAPCDERTGGVYTLRTVLEHFNLGIPRSYLYEAIDLWSDNRVHAENNFGILRADFSPKPAYTFVKNLLATTASPQGATLTPLKFNVEYGPSDLRRMLLRQADGDYVVALWRHASVWNSDRRQPIPVAPVDVRLSLPTAGSVATVEPHRGTAETNVPITGRRVAVPVGGDAVLLVVR